MLETEFISKEKGFENGIIYTVKGEFDYSIGHFVIESVSYINESGVEVSFVDDSLTLFISVNHEKITEQIMVENDIYQNDDYLLGGSSTFGIVLNGTPHPYPPKFHGEN